MPEQVRDTRLRKIHFRLNRDQAGYPPAHVESLWGERVGDSLYQIDNIPFFVRGVSSDDTVRVVEKDGELWFEEVVSPSDHSTVRLLFADVADVDRLRAELVGLGCAVELSHLPRLAAVDIPGCADTPAVLAVLIRELRSRRVSCEEACVNWPDGALPSNLD